MMDWLRGFWLRVRAALFRGTFDRDMDEELRFHVDMEIQKNVRDGMSPNEARRKALVAFGGIERHREALREGRSPPLIDSLARDLRYAARGMRRNPVFSLVAIGTIGLGIGATTSVFTVLNSLFFQPLDVPGANRVFAINEQRSGGVSNGAEGTHLPYPRYQTYVERLSDAFSELAAHRVRNVSVRVGDQAESTPAALISGNYFQALQLRPALGRFPTASASPEVTIGYSFWQSRFGGDPDAIGRALYVDGDLYTVVAVAPANFRGVVKPLDTQMWIPYETYGSRDMEGGSFAHTWVGVFGRLGPGITVGQAQAQLDVVSTSVAPREGSRIRSSRLAPPTFGGPQGLAAVGGFLGLLTAMGLFVLIIASANVAAMLVARGTTRRREVSIRLAIGAGTKRIARQLLTEALVLFVFGGALGVLIAYGSAALLESISLPVPVAVALEFAPDTRVMAFALTLALATGMAFGLRPALRVRKTDVVTGLKGGGRNGGPQSSRTRGAFITAQVAMCTFLLVVASLIGRSLQGSLDWDLGFEPTGVVLATIDLSAHAYDDVDAAEFYRSLLETVRDLPDVLSASAAGDPILQSTGFRTDVRPIEEGGEAIPRTNAGVNSVEPQFFETMRIQLTSGRVFTSADGAGAEAVAIVNQTLADRLWPGRNPIGQIVRGAGARTVVGVTENGKYFFAGERPVPYLILPAAQRLRSRQTIYVRAPGAEAETLQSLRETIRDLDSNVAVENDDVLAEAIDASLFPYRFAAYVVGIFGALALLLAASGLYGVLAFNVAQRTREFGIRRAVGAEGFDLVKQVLAHGVLFGAIGCLIGLFPAGALALWLQSFLLGLDPIDPITFTLVPIALLATTLVASYFPAVRATKVPATDALRAE